MYLAVGTHFVIILSICYLSSVCCKKFKEGEEKPKWAQKDIRFYNDADVERLLEQWEVSFIVRVI